MSEKNVDKNKSEVIWKWLTVSILIVITGGMVFISKYFGKPITVGEYILIAGIWIVVFLIVALEKMVIDEEDDKEKK